MSLMQKDLQTGSMAAAENTPPARVRTMMTLLNSLFFSQDAPAPETHRTVCHFEHKNDIIVNLTFPILETSVL